LIGDLGKYPPGGEYYLSFGGEKSMKKEKIKKRKM
jgi:hypothetical protein